MCLGCMSEENIYNHLTKQLEFIRTHDLKYQSDNTYDPDATMLLKMSQDALNIEDYLNWKDDKIGLYIGWYFTRNDMSYIYAEELLKGYYDYLSENCEYDKMEKFRTKINSMESSVIKSAKSRRGKFIEKESYFNKMYNYVSSYLHGVQSS